MMDFAFDVPTPEQLVRAHEVYGEKELRDTDEYWDASERVAMGFRDNKLAEIAGGIAPLLKSWNRNHYRFNPAKKARLELELEQLVTEHLSVLVSIRGRSITSLSASDRAAIVRLFSAFERELGPVGSAKALNLLAPFFFPLWDNAIAFRYGVVLAASGYVLFMLISKYQDGTVGWCAAGWSIAFEDD